MRQPASFFASIVIALGLASAAGCAPGARSVPPSVRPASPDGMQTTPASLSPARFATPPMPQTLPQPPSAMNGRTTRSDISMVGWNLLPGAARELAASPDGSLWALSTHGNGTDYYIYHYANGAWTNVQGAAIAIAVAPNGTPWVVTSAGTIYYRNGSVWTAIAGGATAITVARDGTLYVVSNQPGNAYGRGIWHYVSGTWSQLPGAAVRLAASWDTASYSGSVTPRGVYAVNAQQSLFYYDTPTGWHPIDGLAYEVAPTRSGGVFALGTNPAPTANGYPIYYRDLNTGSWSLQPGAAASITTDGVTVYAANAQGDIYYAPVNAHHILGNGTPLAGPTFGPSSHGWGPRSVANALSFPVQSGFDGKGLTVAIVIDSTVVSTDISGYLSYFQTPSTGRTVSYVMMPDSSATPTSDGQFEATLDVQTVAGLAPGANVLVYVMQDLSFQHTSDAYNQVLSDGQASIVSSSFGGCENSSSSAQNGANTIMSTGAQNGVAFIAISGDWGNECYYNSTTFHQGVNWPGSNPDVIGVGGTETAPGYALTSTTPWNDTFAFAGQEATGGGVSTVFALPSYQTGLAGAASTQFRNVPDIALPAVDSAIYYNGSWARAVGTSWSTPMFAAMLAEVYQYCNAVFLDPVTLPYYVWSTAGSGAFIDVTAGNNQFQGTMPYYTAGTGYDNLTGLGVPLGMLFAQTLCPNRVPAARARRTASHAPAVHGPAEPVAADVVPRVRDVVDQGARPAAATTRIQLVLRPTASLANDEHTVIGVLQSAGFTIVRTFKNHLVVDAEGPASSVEGLFSTRLHDVVQGRYGRRYMPVAGAVIPASLAPYVAGVSLDDVIAMKHL